MNLCIELSKIQVGFAPLCLFYADAEGAVIAVQEHAGDGSLVVIESGKIRRMRLVGLGISLLAHSEPFMFNNVACMTSQIESRWRCSLNFVSVAR